MSTSSCCRPQDAIQTLVLLKEEKRFLLLQQTEIQQTSKQGPANGENSTAFAHLQQQQLQQLRRQMNDFNKRLYAVVQRMSAYDRYKRKKTTTHTVSFISRTQEINAVQASAAITQLEIGTPLDDTSQQLAQTNQTSTSVDRLAAHKDSQLTRRIFETILPPMIVWWFLRIMIRLVAVDIRQQALKEDLLEDKKMRSEFANTLRAEFSCETIAEEEEEEQQQSETRELSESDQFRQTLRDQFMSVIRSSREHRKEMERSRREAKERDRLHLLQLTRQMAKRRANDEWRMKWLDQLDLVFERRENQSANAG